MKRFDRRDYSTSSLDAIETEGLLYIREEEKLAHDVYVTLYKQWGSAIFNNIASSEERHQSQIADLLDRYQLEDPASDNSIGVFVNPDLQQLYENLVAQGSQSLTEALKVGVWIEETDLVDLQERIAETDNTDIQQVYANLLNGSNNHLSAFTSQLTNTAGNTNLSAEPIAQTQETTTDDLLTGGDFLTETSDINALGSVASFADFLLDSPIQSPTVWEVDRHVPGFYEHFDNPKQLMRMGNPVEIANAGLFQTSNGNLTDNWKAIASDLDLYS